VLGLLRNRTAFTVALAGLSALVLAHAPYIRLVAAADYVPWAGFFAFGALCYVFRDRAFVSWTILAGLASLCALLRGTAGYPLALGATIAYAALWLGFTPLFRHWRLENDYSYGIYLYGFPAQQTWAALYPDWGPWSMFFVSASSAVLLGAMSWHFIEHPALRLKVALPGAKRRARGGVAENPSAGIRIDHGESARVGNR